MLLHRFYFRQSMSVVHFKLLRVCMTAMFLACKAEETPIGLRDICAVFDRLLKRRAGVDCTPLSDARRTAWTESIKTMEGIMLRECGFEVSCETPHALLLHCLAYMRPRQMDEAQGAEAKEKEESKRWADLQQRSWAALNDSLLSSRILFAFKAEVVACAAIRVASSLLSLALPPEWWMLFDVRTPELDQCALEMATLYARLSRYTVASGTAEESETEQLDYKPTDPSDNETNNELIVYKPRNRQQMLAEVKRKKEEAAAAAGAGAAAANSQPAAASSATASSSSAAVPTAADAELSRAASPAADANGSAPMQM